MLLFFILCKCDMSCFSSFSKSIFIISVQFPYTVSHAKEYTDAHVSSTTSLQVVQF